MDILRGSVHDGPGIRTTVFLKGCTLHCLWCHNPEGISKNPQLRYDDKKCIRCKKCMEACPVNALSIVGHKMTSGEVLGLVKKDMAFYQKTGDGVTLSGGEPLMQPDFALELLSGCQKYRREHYADLKADGGL